MNYKRKFVDIDIYNLRLIFEFDRIIERWGTDSVKYDGTYEEFGYTDVLPMWVADMDFEVAPATKETVLDCGRRGVYGYTFRSQEGKQAFREWVKCRHGWEVDTAWLSSSPGVVTALALSVRAFTSPGYKHTVMASLSDEIAERTLTAMAPSKTFNIAGMMNSVVVASNPELLERYNRELLSLHLDSGNIFGHVALKAAYCHGDAWLDGYTAPFLINSVQRRFDP